MKISVSKENYLKAIFHLQVPNGTVTTNALAASLHTRPASVTDMLKKLKKENLVLYEKYKGFRLSREGRKLAVRIVRKHRLWEYFLVEKLQFGWDEVHEVAEELEHISSKKMIDRLDRFLDFPQSDPHGDPIPDSQGRFHGPEQRSLLEVSVNQPVTVCGIASQTTDILDLLQHKQIQLGTRIEVKKIYAFDHSIEIKIPHRPPMTISEQLARNILVKNES